MFASVSTRSVPPGSGLPCPVAPPGLLGLAPPPPPPLQATPAIARTPTRASALTYLIIVPPLRGLDPNLRCCCRLHGAFGNRGADVPPGPPFGALPRPPIRERGGSGIEGVPEAVPDQVEGRGGEEQEHPGEEHRPPGRIEDLRRVRDLAPPGRGGRGDADAEVRQRGLEQDVGRDDQR